MNLPAYILTFTVHDAFEVSFFEKTVLNKCSWDSKLMLFIHEILMVLFVILFKYKIHHHFRSLLKTNIHSCIVAKNLNNPDVVFDAEFSQNYPTQVSEWCKTKIIHDF